jgi:tRNA (mo5U34)-methyltransferase
MSEMTDKKNVEREAAEKRVQSRPWWYHKFEISAGVWTPGVYDPSGTYNMLNLPADMNGLRVLEIGPADGYFTKRMTEAGAEVVAVDYCEKDHHGFAAMEELSGRKFEYHKANLYELPSLGLQGQYDIVMILGVLYHLPDMIRAFWTLKPYVKHRLLLEGLISRSHEDKPIAEYLPAATWNNDMTNFWAPNPLCCEMMLKDCGFSVDRKVLNDNRGLFDSTIVKAPDADKKARLAYSFLDA